MRLRMLKLLPEQVARYWDELGDAIISSIPPTVLYSPDMRYLTLDAILSGRLEVWTFYKQPENGDTVKILVIMTTAIVSDVGSSYKSLLIYSIYGYQQDVSPKDWLGGLNMIKAYAKSKGCKNVLAYSDVENIKKLVKVSGGNIDYSLLVMEV